MCNYELCMCIMDECAIMYVFDGCISLEQSEIVQKAMAVASSYCRLLQQGLSAHTYIYRCVTRLSTLVNITHNMTFEK